MKKYVLIAFALGVAVGFFLNKEKYEVVVKEVKGEIVKVDKITNIMVVDTLAILKDYTAIKHYSYTLFDNEHGTLKLSQKTQYNSLIYTAYTYTPIKRVESKLKRW